METKLDTCHSAHHVIQFSDLVDLWVIKVKKPMILCARSTSTSREHKTQSKKPGHVKGLFIFFSQNNWAGKLRSRDNSQTCTLPQVTVRSLRSQTQSLLLAGFPAKLWSGVGTSPVPHFDADPTRGGTWRPFWPGRVVSFHWTMKKNIQWTVGGFLCNWLSCFTTAKITFISFLNRFFNLLLFVVMYRITLVWQLTMADDCEIRCVTVYRLPCVTT